MPSTTEQQEPPKAEFFSVHRNAHKVFRVRKGAHRFNPFRHIAWVSKDPNDVEAGARRRRTNEVPKVRGKGWFKYQCPDPEEPFTVANQFRRTILTSWISILLLCVPIGLSLRYGSQIISPQTFVFNYMAEFPLWFMCDYALEEMEQYIGWAPADLLEIFTTNTVQVISSVLLLKANQLSILQTSLIGGILSNILMLLGLSFLIGGVNNHEQHFIRTGAQGASSLLSIAATSLLIPTSVKLLKQGTPKGLVLQSRGVAFVLLLVYITYTICQMGTHRDEYNNLGKQGKGAASQQGTPRPQPPENGIELAVIVSGTQTAQMPIGQAMMRPSSNPSPNPSEPNHPESIDQKSDNQIRGPHLNFWVATTVFSVTIVLLFFCISATVDSISVLMEQRNLSPTFVALILLPIPNCDFAPISLAVDDLLEETMKYTVGRSIQTALLVEPMVVLLSWWMGVPGVTLAFDGFEVVSLFTTILLLNFLVIDAKVHWVHGVLLLADWVLIGIAAYFVRPEAST